MILYDDIRKCIATCVMLSPTPDVSGAKVAKALKVHGIAQAGNCISSGAAVAAFVGSDDEIYRFIRFNKSGSRVKLNLSMDKDLVQLYVETLSVRRDLFRAKADIEFLHRGLIREVVAHRDEMTRLLSSLGGIEGFKSSMVHELGPVQGGTSSIDSFSIRLDAARKSYFRLYDQYERLRDIIPVLSLHDYLTPEWRDENQESAE